MNFRQLILGGLVASSTIGLGLTGAKAEAYFPGASYSIACANGANYVLESGPVANPGDVVTARLYLTPHHGVPVRLIPMGDGYRYAGRGVWLDGIREHALIYLHKYEPTPCVVARI